MARPPHATRQDVAAPDLRAPEYCLRITSAVQRLGKVHERTVGFGPTLAHGEAAVDCERLAGDIAGS